MKVFSIKASAFIIMSFCMLFSLVHTSVLMRILLKKKISVERVIERVRFQNSHAAVLIKNIDEQGGKLFGCSSRELAPR
jgi:hypothetical protein